jgi:ArsR family transcriptional regulator
MSNYQKEGVERFAGIFKGLSNPNRLRIFLRLVSCCAPGTVCTVDDRKAYVGELARDLDVGPSTVSHHIKELHRAGLIRMERKGQNVECWVDPEVLQDLAGFFSP